MEFFFPPLTQIESVLVSDNLAAAWTKVGEDSQRPVFKKECFFSSHVCGLGPIYINVCPWFRILGSVCSF